jgi:hypothetical protein
MMNPLRDIVTRLGRQTIDAPSPFRAEADDVLERFRAQRQELETKVKRGDLTTKVAREQAKTIATDAIRVLKNRAGDFTIVPRVFMDRLVEASDRRKANLDRTSLETLQRETNRLLRSVLLEQQMESRKGEFESRTYVRQVNGGQPAPSLENLLTFHQTAKLGGDDAALEWTTRQLEAFRPLVTRPEDHRRIDLATDRPDRVNPRLVETYIEAMKNREAQELERFVTESITSEDTNACMAAFILAREVPDGTRMRWVRLVLEGLGSFPDVALASLRDLEANSRAADRDAAIVQADFIVAVLDAEARLDDVASPTESEMSRRAAMEARPAARPGESIGLALNRRGELPGDTPFIEHEQSVS